MWRHGALLEWSGIKSVWVNEPGPPPLRVEVEVVLSFLPSRRQQWVALQLQDLFVLLPFSDVFLLDLSLEIGELCLQIQNVISDLMSAHVHLEDLGGIIPGDNPVGDPLSESLLQDIVTRGVLILRILG